MYFLFIVYLCSLPIKYTYTIFFIEGKLAFDVGVLAGFKVLTRFFFLQIENMSEKSHCDCFLLVVITVF